MKDFSDGPIKIPTCRGWIKVTNLQIGASVVVEILIVDDDLDSGEAMSELLASQGFEVALAADGQRALEAMRGAHTLPDIILLDLMMPVMDGFQMLTELRQRPDWRKIPVIVMTAKDLSVADRQLLMGQTEKILQKGSTVREDLVQEVRKCLNRRIE